MTYHELDLVVLKNILTDKKNALDFVHESDEKLFTSDLLRFTKIVIEHIKTYKEPPTRNIITEKVKASKNETLIKYVNTVWDDVEKTNIDPKEFKFQLEKLKSRFAYKLLYGLKDSLTNSQDLDLKKTVAELTTTVNQIKSLNEVKAFEQKSLKENIQDFRSKYMARQNNKNFYGGFKTGYSFLDKAIGTIREGELLVIGAESGCGKSLLMQALGLSMFLGENTVDMVGDFKPGGADVLYFSLEMPYDDMHQRCLASMAKVNEVNIRDACLDNEEKAKVAQVLKFIEKYDKDFTIVDAARGVTIETIESVFEEICQTKRKPRVVIVDYMALMGTDKDDESDWLKLNYLSEELHEFARVHNIVVITASQLNAANDKKSSSENTGLHRLSRSKLIAANANFVLMIEKRQDEHKHSDMLIHLIKSRRSALVSGVIHKQLNTCSLLDKPLSDHIEGSLLNDEDLSDQLD